MGDAVLQLLQGQVGLLSASFLGVVEPVLVQGQVPGDFSQKGFQQTGFLRGHGVPGLEPGVVDALLAVLPVLEDVPGDGAAVGTIFQVGLMLNFLKNERTT